MAQYSITQVAEKLGIKVHTIRYWEKHIPLLAVRRDEYGKRWYSKHDIYILYRVWHLIEKNKFTLQGAAAALINEVSSGQDNPKRVKFLALLKQFELHRDTLQQAKHIIDYIKNFDEEDIQ